MKSLTPMRQLQTSATLPMWSQVYNLFMSQEQIILSSIVKLLFTRTSASQNDLQVDLTYEKTL